MPEENEPVAYAIKKGFQEDIYLHLQPKRNFPGGRITGFTVVKMAKSLDAEAAPRTRVVKITIAIPGRFFVESMPSARVEIEPGRVIPLIEAIQAADETEEQS